MTEAEREAFVAGVHVAVLAVDHPGHGPLALPIWYLWENGSIVMRIGDDSLKAKLLRAAGRATLTVQDEAPPYKYVSVEGPVTVGREDREVLPLATRYLGPVQGAVYAEQDADQSGVVTAWLTPERWRTIDYSKMTG